MPFDKVQSAADVGGAVAAARRKQPTDPPEVGGVLTDQGKRGIHLTIIRVAPGTKLDANVLKDAIKSLGDGASPGGVAAELRKFTKPGQIQMWSGRLDKKLRRM